MSMSSTDFMPLDGWDHVELWVGNAKQAAYFYEQAFGFTRTAYCGPETGVRDRASYVLEQGEIRLVLTSGLRSDSEICRFATAHGDGVKDVALRVPDATHASGEAIHTEYSALMSKVMTDGEGKIKFPINEPAEGKRKSQIEEYLDYYGSPGVQHLALQSGDIVATVTELKERGVGFLDTPDTY